MREIHKYYIALSFGAFGAGVLSIILPIYLRDSFNTSLTELGLIFSMMSLFVILLQIPLGHIADKIGKKTLLVVAGAFYMTALAFYGLAGAVYHFFIGKSFEGVSEAIRKPVGNALIAELSELKHYGKSFGDMMGIGVLNFTLGIFLASTFVDVLGVKNTLLCMILFEALSAVIIWFIAEPKKKEKVETTLRGMFSALHKHMKSFALVCFMIIFVESMDFTITIIYMKEVLGASMSTIGVVFGLSFLVFAITSSFGGRVSGKYGWKKTAVAGILLSSAMAFSLPYANSLLVFGILFGILCFGYGFVFPSIYALIAKYAYKHARAREFAFVTTFESLGAFVGVILLGYVADTLGMAVPFTIRGIILIFAAIILYVRIEDR